jgi:hypothetical protein
MIRDRFGLLQGQLDRHCLGPVPTPAREARRGAVELLALHQIRPVLAEQGQQLADQPLIAAGAIGKGAPGHQLKPPMARTTSCLSCCSSVALIRESVTVRNEGTHLAPCWS